MVYAGCKLLLASLLMSAIFLIAGCGGGAGSGAPNASLALSLSSSEIASGTAVSATITLTAQTTGAALNGIRVRAVSSDSTVAETVEGYTNSSGIAVLSVPTKWIASDKTITLRAESDGITPSANLTLKVLAPKLTCSIPLEITPPTWNNNYAFIGKTIVANYQLKFVDGSGNPIPNQSISLYIDSLTNKDANDQIVYTPVQGSMIIAPPGVFTGTTDSSGIIIIPMYIQMAMAQPAPCSTDATTGLLKCTGKTLSIMTANWRAVTLFAGQTITTTGSSLITFTNTGI